LDTHDFLADPRAIGLAERRATATRMHREQRAWLERLRALVEGPAPGADFPAFLLATPPFAKLALRLGTATTRAELPTETADELERFVDAFRDYLRTDVGEDVFAKARSGRC
jgi:hypothetical protein